MRAATSIATVAIALFLLSGCVPQPSPATPTPVASSTPVFASDEEALAAATAAYAAYQATIDHALATYATEDLADVAAGPALDAALSSVDSFRLDGKRLVGNSKIDTTSVAQFGILLGGSSEDPAQIYGCLDISGTDVVNEAGQSLVTRSGNTRVPMLVSLEWAAEFQNLLVAEVEVWDGNDFCN